jgi:hypothetical protein
MLPEDLLRNSSPLASLGIASFSNSSNRLKADTMVNNPRTPSRNQPQTLLTNSANSMLPGKRDSGFKPPIFSPHLLIRESCNNHLQKSSCLQMRL